VVAQAQRSNPYRNWSAMAARNVRELLELKQLWTARCGRMCVRMHRIQDWLSASFSKSASVPAGDGGLSAYSTAAPAPLFHHQIALNGRFFAHLHLYVTGDELPLSVAHDEHAAYFGGAQGHQGDPAAAAAAFSPRAQSTPQAASFVGASSIEGKILSLQSLLASFDSFLTVLESGRFESSFRSAIHLRRKPHHLFEYWHYYCGGLALVGAGAYLCVRHSARVLALAQDTATFASEFIYEHVTEPLTNIAAQVTSTFQDRSLFSTNVKTLAQSKDDLTRMLRTFAAHHAAELAEHEGIPRADYEASIARRAAEGDMSLVMRTYEREVQRPILTLLTGDLMRGLLIQVQKVKIDTEAAMLAADQGQHSKVQRSTCRWHEVCVYLAYPSVCRLIVVCALLRSVACE